MYISLGVILAVQRHVMFSSYKHLYISQIRQLREEERDEQLHSVSQCSTSCFCSNVVSYISVVDMRKEVLDSA
jgi:hypothetical protein